MQYGAKIVDEVSSGYFAGQYGLPCPSDASEYFKEGYGRAYEIAERQTHEQEKRELR